MLQVTPRQLADWLADASRTAPLLLDVREPAEYEICHLEGACLVPMREIPARIAELDPGRDTVVICHHGGRSLQVALYLEKNGFGRVHNLQGGVDVWAQDVDPAMRRY
ncbi:MAG: sulfurtransferase [Betaproteobacteria bacterium]|nr:sulfurtransferase [Betaproteobacteria bacterium]